MRKCFEAVWLSRETKWFLKRVTRGQPSAFSLRFRLTCRWQGAHETYA